MCSCELRRGELAYGERFLGLRIGLEMRGPYSIRRCSLLDPSVPDVEQEPQPRCWPAQKSRIQYPNISVRKHF